MSKNNEEYLDVVLLIRRTTKIESTLEALGGSGGGIWEKANSISNEFPNNFMQKIINIGISRNEAVHGDLKVNNIDFVIKECDSILEILENKNKIVSLKKHVNLKLNEFHYFDKSNKIKLDANLDLWIEKLNTFNNKPYNSNVLEKLLDEEKGRLEELYSHLKNYIVSRKLKQLLRLVGLSITLGLIYILLGNVYDR